MDEKGYVKQLAGLEKKIPFSARKVIFKRKRIPWIWNQIIKILRLGIG